MVAEPAERAGKGFDASRYLMRLKGKDYLEVKWRICWLRTEQPDAVIETEMVSHIQNPPMAVFKAKVTLPSGGSATGWGQEEAADFGDYIEKAETKAIGRALGALGFGTQFTEDFEFADKHGGLRVVDAPVERDEPKLPHPDAEDTGDTVRGATLWRVGSVVCLEQRKQNGSRYLASTERCPQHNTWFYLSPDGAPDAWAHGSGKDKCERSFVMKMAVQEGDGEL